MSARIGAHRTWASAALAIATTVAVAACGSASPSASASQPASVAPSAAAPSVASIAPSTPASVAPTAPASTAPSGGTGSASDPAKDVKIAAPYALVELPPAAGQILEQQMATNLGGAAGKVTFGFRQVTGGAGPGDVLLVLQFAPNTLSDIGYGAVLGGMTASMKADLTKSTESGVEISSGKIQAGSMAIFHKGDTLFVAISSTSQDALPIAKALVKAN
jgi:hypothetical protein